MKKLVLGLLIFVLCVASVSAVMLDYDFGSYTNQKHPYTHGLVGDYGYEEWAIVMEADEYHPCMSPQYQEQRFYAGSCVKQYPDYSKMMFSSSDKFVLGAAPVKVYDFESTDSFMVTVYSPSYSFYAGS